MDEEEEDRPPTEGAEPPPRPAPLPADDPADHEEGKSFAVRAERLRDAMLTVTVGEGDVASFYAPAHLTAGLTDRVHALMREVGGGLQLMFYGALSAQSMTLFFGDPRPEEAQAALPIEATLANARRVAELIDLDGDELFAEAVRIGRPAQRYHELVQFIENQGITVVWQPRGERARELTAKRAAAQSDRLSKEPPISERELVVNGVLYRVITDRSDGRLGSVGIRLHDWSARPPARGGSKPKVILPSYARQEVEEAIKDGLIGEPVEATILIRQPIPGASLDAEDVTLELIEIARGPTQESRKGPQLFDDDELLDDEE